MEYVIQTHGRIDLLVNSAWRGSKHVMQPYYFNALFWQQPVKLWDDHYSVGLQSNYVLSRAVANHMVELGQGLMINISFYGGKQYYNNVSYGVMKSALDRLSLDMAHDLSPYQVRVYSLYPNSVKTEGMIELAKYSSELNLDKMESPQYVGRCVLALMEDTDNKMNLQNGQVVITTEIAKTLGITDIDGSIPESLKPVLWAE